MTNEVMEKHVIELLKYQKVCAANKESIMEQICAINAEVAAIRDLKSDFKLMILNFENMQKDLKRAVDKMDAIEQQGFKDYKSAKRTIRNTVITVTTSAFVGFVVGLIAQLINII